jgi:hypothetical protein
MVEENPHLTEPSELTEATADCKKGTRRKMKRYSHLKITGVKY